VPDGKRRSKPTKATAMLYPRITWDAPTLFKTFLRFARSSCGALKLRVGKMRNLLQMSVVISFVLVQHPAIAATDYEIEAVSNDETFIINGEVFKARTYCLGWEKDDRVIFLEGDPSGACVSAALYNRRTKDTCEVWCE
jgi:hypothetical protein